MAYSLSRPAVADLDRIYREGLGRFGVRHADRYQDRLKATFDLLGANPRLARERREFDPPIRVHPCGSHIIVYSVDGDDEVLIVRVRHGREDWAGDVAEDAED